MPAIARDDNAPDDDEHADGEKQMFPSGAIECECTNRPDDNQYDADQNTEIHFIDPSCGGP
jgi:hypothetical protein